MICIGDADLDFQVTTAFVTIKMRYSSESPVHCASGLIFLESLPLQIHVKGPTAEIIEAE